MKTFNNQFVTAGDLSANLTSNPIQIDDYWGYAIAAIITGTPTGTLKLQASCDPPQSPLGQGFAPTNWVDISGTSQAIAGSATTVLYNYTDVCYNWIRLVYTKTGSTGAITAIVNCKGV